MTRGRSLQRELPIGMAVLLVLIVFALAFAMYREVRRSTIEGAADRLERTTLQLSQMLAQSTRLRFAVIESTAALPSVRQFMRAPAGARPPLEPIQKLATAQLVTDVELWDAAGNRLASTGTTIAPLDSARAHAVIGGLREGKSALGRFDRVGDSVTYTLLTQVNDGAAHLGYIVERRRLSGQQQGSRVLAELIGEGSTLAIGNSTGDVWTDFTRPVPGPPVDVLSSGLHEYQRDSVRVFARSARIAGTPWQVVVEFPRDLVLARVNALLVRLVLITVAVLIVGVGAAWLTSRWITRPLREVTDAAEAIAAGQSAAALPVHRQDEIGRLTKAFNSMSHEVAQSRHRLEAQVEERTAALQETMQELEAFSYTVSHDLRAPLRAMQGFAQALLEDYAPSLDSTARDYATRVVDASRRMDDLIQDLLAYSRLTREQLSIGPVDLDRLLPEVVSAFEEDVLARGGRIAVATPLGSVIGNARILQQIVTNLLGNAVKFVPPGVTPEIHVRSEAHDGKRRLWVEDNGIGIAPEHQERIFRVFERLHGGETYPGTGIGLAIVRRGLERMDGTVGVESVPGKGSRFWIELPLEESA